MRRGIIFSFLFVAGAIGGYFLFLQFLPVYTTNRILMAVTGGKKELHRWYYIPGLSGKDRAVRMASPDFYYSYCLFDLSADKIQVKVAPWDGFQTLTVYDLRDRHIKTFEVEEGKQFSTVLSDLPVTKGFLMLRRVRKGPYRTDHGDLCQKI